jgi:hypothetical protein
LFLCRAGAAVGAAATANAGGIVAAGGAALSAGAGAVASAASALFNTVSGAGDGAASGAPSGVPRPHNHTGTRPKRKVVLALQILQLCVVDDICCGLWLEPYFFSVGAYLIILFQDMLDSG